MNSLNSPSIGPEPGSSGVLQQSSMDVKPIAFQVGAGILFTSSLLSLASLLLGSAPNIIALVIDVWLAISLLKLSTGARNFTLFRAYAGALIFPILFFVQHDPVTAVILSIIQVAYCGSLILVLQGATRNWKIYLAIGIFVVFVLCVMSVLYLLAFIGSSVQ